MGKRPDYKIKAVYNAEGRKPFFSTIGAGWINRNKRIILHLREVPRESKEVEVMIYLEPIDRNQSNGEVDYESGPFRESVMRDSHLI